VEFLTFDDVLRKAHVLSLHLPAAADTHHLLNASCFERMRPDVIVINTARGSLIDESTLIGALSRGQVAAAGLDVFEREPLSGENPLLTFPQVVTSPHCAWLTPETLDRSTRVIMENCRRLGARETLLHEVLPARR
jgi:phosphoglycerate dehydrogenase-like enzyme